MYTSALQLQRRSQAPSQIARLGPMGQFSQVTSLKRKRPSSDDEDEDEEPGLPCSQFMSPYRKPLAPITNTTAQAHVGIMTMVMVFFIW